MSFTDEEVAYLRSQPLARLATVSEQGQPDVVPVGYDFDGAYFYVSGHGDPVRTRKFRNVLAGNTKVALVFDDLVSTTPWTPRFLRVYGTADVVERGGYAGPGTYLRITPTMSWSWNLDGRQYAGESGDGPAERRVDRTVHRSTGAGRDGLSASESAAIDRARAEDRAAIERTVTRLEHAQHYERPDEFMQLLRPDAVWVTAHGKRLTGWDEINAFTQRVLPGAMKDATARYDVAHVLFVRPDVAVVNVRQRPITHTGEPLEGVPQGSPVYVMVKERDEWIIVAGQNTQIKEP